MRVFLTGASGYIGSALVVELLDAGHSVVGLARSEESAAALASAGVEVRRGSLEDLDGLRAGAADADGVIHIAFNHDFSNYQGAADADRTAIAVLGESLVGSDRPLIVTSGTAVLEPGRLGTEEDAGSPVAPRISSETAALPFADRGVRAAVVRLAPSVHSAADARGFVPTMIDIARAKGVAAYVGDGANRWPAVHRLDAAHLFRLALEQAPAGSRLHGAAEEGVPLREVAEVIGRRLKLPVIGLAPEDAVEHFGWLAHFVTIDNPTSSALTRKRFGWNPVQPGLIEDLDAHYFGQSISSE